MKNKLIRTTKNPDLETKRYQNSISNSKSGSNINYSTEEQIVGTWISGKPLYEKTWHWDNYITITGNKIISLTESGVVITDGDLIVDAKIVSEVDKRFYNAFFVGYAANEIKIQNTEDADIAMNALTLRYTKTTD